ncbi:hypothetical protein [Mycobacterium tuberculosis]
MNSGSGNIGFGNSGTGNVGLFNSGTACCHGANAAAAADAPP